MILILNILNKTKAVWLIYNQNQIKFQHQFAMEVGEENVLVNLDKFLRKNKLSLRKISGFGLSVQETSLTQVKVVTSIINTLGWNFNRPTAAVFNYKDESISQHPSTLLRDVSTRNKNVLVKLVSEIKKNKKFKQIKVKYERKPVITISKKKSKFKIIP